MQPRVLNLTLWFHSGLRKAGGERGHRCYAEVQPPCSRPSPWPSRSQAAAQLPEFTSWGGGRDPKPANQQDPEAGRSWGSGLFQRVSGGSRGPANSTAETSRMKRALPGRVQCPLQREQWCSSYLGVSEARGAGRGGRACGPGQGEGGCLPFQGCSGQTSAHPEERGWWAWQTEYQEGWGRGIRGMERA